MNTLVMGVKIRKYREKCDLTIEQLAKKAGLSVNFIGNIERGSDVPSLKSLLKIVNILGTGIDCILEEDLMVERCKINEKQDYYTKAILEELEVMTEGQKASIYTIMTQVKLWSRSK